MIAFAAMSSFVLAGCGWLNVDSRHVDEDDFGTPSEVGAKGDGGNPGELFAGRYPSYEDTQERTFDQPARFSGYTTWIESIERVPASEFVDGYTGDFLRVHVTIFNRDPDAAQDAGAYDFRVWSEGAGRRTADFVDAALLPASVSLEIGGRLTGDVYLYVGEEKSGLFVEYDPEDNQLFQTGGSGVWEVPPT